jgi:hypothetical protein
VKELEMHYAQNATTQRNQDAEGSKLKGSKLSSKTGAQSIQTARFDNQKSKLQRMQQKILKH